MITDHILPAKFFVLVYTTIGMLSFANNSVFADAHQSNVDKPTILITGSYRGIGLEFVRQLSLRDWRIIATARAPQDATDDGQFLNPSRLEYKMPRAYEMPEVEYIIVESIDPYGPFGAKEVGEGPIVVTVGAIATAVSNAVGAYIPEIPMTPWKVLRVIRQQQRKTRRAPADQITAA